jgi:gliding motility-associated-like protein
MRRWIVCLGLLTGMVAIGNTLWAQEPTPCDYQLPMRASNWVFGEQARIGYDSGVASAERVDASFTIPNGAASISDENGNLLFFSDGIRLWSGNYFIFQGTSDLQGNDAATQSALFVPHPNRNDRIYLFTVDMYFPLAGFNKGVRYTTIQREGNNWNVSNKNQLLHQSNAQKITAAKHANGEHYWVITHGYNDTGNNFFAWLVDSLGVSNSPVTSTIGAVHATDPSDPITFNNNGGYMRASSDGSKIALTLPHDGVIELFDFDAATGLVSNRKTSGAGSFYYPFGVEFSPDNTKLYATTSPLELNRSTSIFQFDLAENNPFENPQLIYEATVTQASDSLMGSLQLAPDGRIYVARSRRGAVPKARLGVIYNPNRLGSACNYNHLEDDNNGLFLEGGMSYQGLPNFVTSFLDIPHFYWQNHCHTYITAFNLRNEANIESIEWDFGDGGAISDGLRAEHTFSEPGRYYTVNVTENYNGQAYTKSRNIYIHPLPEVDIGQGSDTIFLLPNSSITLDAGIFDAYAWEPSGSTERFLDVDAEGWVTVTVTDSNCCVNTASVYIAFSNIFLPTAFRPGSDRLVNSQFKVLGATSAIADFRIYIYNRWGELVFESADPDTGWDGTITNGNLAPMGTYAWVMYYESFGTSLQPPQKINRRGTVTLVR